MDRAVAIQYLAMFFLGIFYGVSIYWVYMRFKSKA